MGSTILVVDDDAATRKMIHTALAARDYEVVEAGTAVEALELIESANPEVVLLDLILPDGDGVDVCRRVRQFSDVSIIMVTAKRDLTDRLAGLDAGADDYVTKPLSMGELVARVSALLRRRHMREEEQGQQLRHAGIALRPAQGIATMDGRDVKLSGAETNILATLIEAEGEPLSPEELARRVWKEDETDPAVLRTHITNIRHKIETNPADPERLVADEEGRYRLNET